MPRRWRQSQVQCVPSGQLSRVVGKYSTICIIKSSMQFEIIWVQHFCSMQDTMEIFAKIWFHGFMLHALYGARRFPPRTATPTQGVSEREVSTPPPSIFTGRTANMQILEVLPIRRSLSGARGCQKPILPRILRGTTPNKVSPRESAFSI